MTHEVSAPARSIIDSIFSGIGRVGAAIGTAGISELAPGGVAAIPPSRPLRPGERPPGFFARIQGFFGRLTGRLAGFLRIPALLLATVPAIGIFLLGGVLIASALVVVILARSLGIRSFADAARFARGVS